MQSQKQTILNLLLDDAWHCTSEFYALYIADPRRRLCDIKKDGYVLENRKCQQHDFHKGYSKEWRLIRYITRDMFGESGKEEVKEYYQPKEALQTSLF